MKRTQRPPFDPQRLKGLSREAKSRLWWDWWCDSTDHSQLLRWLGHGPTKADSRQPLVLDPALPLNVPMPQGWRCPAPVLVTNPTQIERVLQNPQDFGNAPYAGLGGAHYLLALDPGAVPVDWHLQQRRWLAAALAPFPADELRAAAALAVRQAALTALARHEFDLAHFAEQATLRYLGLLFGFGHKDHPLLEEASRTTYRALQYLAMAQHFVTEPTLLPAAQAALAKLAQRADTLADEYAQRQYAPRTVGPVTARDWPVGVQPWADLGLRGLGEPVLRRQSRLVFEDGKDTALSARDIAVIVACTVAGTPGNFVNALCALVHGLWQDPDLPTIAALQPGVALEATLEERLKRHPPIRVLPRRARRDGVTLDPHPGADDYPVDTDFLLLTEAHPGLAAWGSGEHACMGKVIGRPLLGALLHHVLNLPAVAQQLDPLTGEPIQPEWLWGLIAQRYPLRYERERRLKQSNLIVPMRVRSPVAEHAARLRRVIAAGVPRIEHELREFGALHFAWFELSEDDSVLTLRTVYDGDLDAYLEFFARRTGDLFDQLFESLEGAPPLPVEENTQAFVSCIRALNRAPLHGYLFRAHPHLGVADVAACKGCTP